MLSEPRNPTAIPVEPQATPPAPAPAVSGDVAPPEPESGGRAGPDPVRYGDWEKNGRCIDF